MLRIKRQALESALAVSKNVYPNEFIGMFKRSEKDAELLSELIITPLSEYRETSSSFPLLMMPTDRLYVATFHSHPSPANWPSEADKNLFSRHYRFHFISGYPYTKQSTRAYDQEGRPIAFQVVD